MASIFLLKSRMKTAKKEWNGRNRGFKAEEATITIIKYSSSFQKKKRRFVFALLSIQHVEGWINWEAKKEAKFKLIIFGRKNTQKHT